MVEGDKDVTTYTTYIGQGSPRFWLGLNPQLPNEAFAEIVIVSKDVEARERIKARLEKALAAGALPEARVRVDRFNFGPPVGFPVQFRVVGPDAMEVRKIAYEVREIMRQNKNAIDPHLDWNERMPSIRLDIDQDRARALGLDPAGRRPDAADPDLGLRRHRRPRRHREGPGGGARGSLRAPRARPHRRPHHPVAERQRRASVAGRAHRAGRGGIDPVAAQPRHVDHRARRRRRRRAAARCHQPDLAAAAGACATSSSPAIASRSAARSRNRRRATARSSRSSR